MKSHHLVENISFFKGEDLFGQQMRKTRIVFEENVEFRLMLFQANKWFFVQIAHLPLGKLHKIFRLRPLRLFKLDFFRFVFLQLSYSILFGSDHFYKFFFLIFFVKLFEPEVEKCGFFKGQTYQRVIVFNFKNFIQTLCFFCLLFGGRFANRFLFLLLLKSRREIDCIWHCRKGFILIRQEILLDVGQNDILVNGILVDEFLFGFDRLRFCLIVLVKCFFQLSFLLRFFPLDCLLFLFILLFHVLALLFALFRRGSLL